MTAALSIDDGLAAAALAGDGLAAEALAARRLARDRKVAAWLAGVLGPCAAETLARAPLGVMRAELLGGGFWAPAEDGAARALLWAAPDPESGLVADLVLLHPKDAARMARRTGAAWAAGDLETLTAAAHPGGFAAVFGGPPALRIFETALAWLRAGAPAWSLAVLDWRHDAARLLLADIDEGLVRPVCDDAEAAARLKRRVRPKRAALNVEIAVRHDAGRRDGAGSAARPAEAGSGGAGLPRESGRDAQGPDRDGPVGQREREEKTSCPIC